MDMICTSAKGLIFILLDDCKLLLQVVNELQHLLKGGGGANGGGTTIGFCAAALEQCTFRSKFFGGCTPSIGPISCYKIIGSHPVVSGLPG